MKTPERPAFNDGLENQTLTQSMLDSLPSHLSPKSTGKYIRAGCPFHGSTSQRSLSINTENQSFKCFSCGAWGYTEQGRDEYKSRKTNSPQRSNLTRRKLSTTMPAPLESDINQYQANLNQARQYLDERKIPFSLAEKLGAGVGHIGGAARLILPHTNPDGEVVSLYGRRIDGGNDFKHYHLSRPKGIFNAQAMQCEDVWITEGAFDCLALIAFGIPNAIAVFGLNGIRWDWLKNTKRIVLCFDIDDSGFKAIKEQAAQAQLRGIEVLAITRDELGGATDIAEAWQKGVLNIEALPGGNKAAKPKTVKARDSAEKRDKENKAVTLERIPQTPPTGCDSARWYEYRDAAWNLFHWHLDDLQNAGWSELEIFGIPRNRSAGGVAWSIRGADIQSIEPDKITVKTTNGSRLSIYRHKNVKDGLKLPF